MEVPFRVQGLVDGMRDEPGVAQNDDKILTHLVPELTMIVATAALKLTGSLVPHLSLAARFRACIQAARQHSFSCRPRGIESFTILTRSTLTLRISGGAIFGSLVDRTGESGRLGLWPPRLPLP